MELNSRRNSGLLRIKMMTEQTNEFEIVENMDNSMEFNRQKILVPYFSDIYKVKLKQVYYLGFLLKSQTSSFY